MKLSEFVKQICNDKSLKDTPVFRFEFDVSVDENLNVVPEGLRSCKIQFGIAKINVDDTKEVVSYLKKIATEVREG